MAIDDKIIRGCKANDIKYQERLYKTCFPEMIGICLRYTYDRQEAEALYNKAFLKVFEKITSFEMKGSFEGWIKRILVNTCIDFVRSKKSNHTSDTIEIDDASGSSMTINAEVLQNIEVEQLMKMINGLSTTRSLIFRLFIIEGYSHQEISDKMGITEASSKWHVFEARKELKVKIKKLYSENHTYLAHGR
jgi:RNA polymerase sigma-70 factor (ECF subfamily)